MPSTWPEPKSQTLVRAGMNQANQYRIKCVGEQYSDLLEKAGVDTLVELSKHVAGNLYTKMVAINKDKNLVNGIPGGEKVEGWIALTKKMRRAVTHWMVRWRSVQ